MPRKTAPPVAHRTAWHPLFLRALRRMLPPRYFDVTGEFQLNWQPLRLDAVVVRKRNPPPGFHPGVLRPVYDHLGQITLIELKGATVSLDWRDLIVFLAAADLFCASEGIRDPRKLCLMMVACRITPRFKQRIRQRGGKLARIGPGVFQISGLPYRMYAIETETVSDHALHVFSRSFLRDPAAMVPLLTEEERAILQDVFSEVRQFKLDPHAQLRYPDYKEVAMSQEEFARAMMEMLPAEERVKGLSPEDRLKGLSPEDRVKGLSPEQVMKGLSPEQVMKGLSPEQVMKGLSPKEKAQLLELLQRTKRNKKS